MLDDRISSSHSGVNVDLKEQRDTLQPDDERLTYVVMTTTDPTGSVELPFAARLFATGQKMRVDVLEWNHFFLRLLDPADLSMVRDGVLCVVLLRFEDWDHFQEYARTRVGEPSYGLVRKKIGDLIYAIDSASARFAGCFLICVLPCSEIVGEVHHLVSFFDDMKDHIRTSLSHHETVEVIDLDKHHRPLSDRLLSVTKAASRLPAI